MTPPHITLDYFAIDQNNNGVLDLDDSVVTIRGTPDSVDPMTTEYTEISVEKFCLADSRIGFASDYVSPENRIHDVLRYTEERHGIRLGMSRELSSFVDTENRRWSSR